MKLKILISRPYFLIGVMVFSSLCALWLGNFQPTSSRFKLKQTGYQVDRYPGSKKGIPTKLTTKPFYAQEKIVTIAFRMRLSAYSPNQNVFATAPGNAGLRMEINNRRVSGLVVALGGNQGIYGIPFPMTWDVGRWYSVDVEFYRDHSLRAFVDGRQVISLTNKDFSPSFSEITVGGGYDAARVFHGDIERFDLQMQAYPYTLLLVGAWALVRALFVAVAIGMLFLLIRGPKDDRRASAGMLPPDEKLALIKLIVICGFIGSVFYHYCLSAYLGNAYPATTFLFHPRGAFGDFQGLYYGNVWRNPYLRDSPSAQYPFLNFLFYLFTKMSYLMASWLYVLLFLAPLLGMLWALPGQANRFNRWGTAITLSLMTYPVLFTLDRGNPEGIVFVLLLGFLWFYQKERYEQSAGFLALAIAMKGFPSIFLALYVADRRWKALAIAITVACLMTVGSLALFRGGFINNAAFILHRGNFHNVHFGEFLGANNLVQRGASLFTGLKIALILTGLMGFINMTLCLHYYVLFAGTVGLLVSGWVVYCEHRLWRRITVLISLMILLPQLSADYKLIHVLLPCIAFVKERLHHVSDWWYAFLFGLLLIPKDYYWLPGVFSDAVANDISIGVFINLITLLALVIGIMSNCLGKCSETPV